jgi:hypothetical protein
MQLVYCRSTAGAASAALVLVAFLCPATVASAGLDVWMVPHAHCDVGWLMSVDGYFNERRSCVGLGFNL